jgi:hypothetical protein
MFKYFIYLLKTQNNITFKQYRYEQNTSYYCPSFAFRVRHCKRCRGCVYVQKHSTKLQKAYFKSLV